MKHLVEVLNGTDVDVLSILFLTEHPFYEFRSKFRIIFGFNVLIYEKCDRFPFIFQHILSFYRIENTIRVFVQGYERLHHTKLD